MNRQISLALIAGLTTLIATQVFAGDASNQSIWNGFYAGADTGAAYSSIQMNNTVTSNGYFNLPADRSQVYNAADMHRTQWRMTAGLFAGYQHLFAQHFVMGLEASANTLSVNNSHSVTEAYVTLPTSNFTLTQSTKASFEGTLRLRLGYAVNRWLAYLTGGPAMTRVRYHVAFSDDNPGFEATGSTSKSNTQYGWALGAGTEYAINHAWGVKLEYLYTHFGELKTNYAVSGGGFTSTLNAKTQLTTQMILLGLSYHF